MADVIAVADGVVAAIVVAVVVSNAVGLNVMRFSLVFGFPLMQSPQQQHRRRFKRLARRGHEQLFPISVFLLIYFSFNVSVFFLILFFRLQSQHIHNLLFNLFTPYSLTEVESLAYFIYGPPTDE